MREVYFYSEKKINKIINEMFIDFEIHTLSEEKIKKNNIKNKNILLITDRKILKDLNKSFFFNNRVVVFCETSTDFDNKIFFDAKIFNKHININKFIDEVITFFVFNSFIYGDIKIWREKIINLKVEKEVFLTPTEKDILTILFERKKIEKKSLLEHALKLRQDTDTKTIESHLTRIRKKLQSINSQIEIVTKENTVFLDF